MRLLVALLAAACLGSAPLAAQTIPVQPGPSNGPGPLLRPASTSLPDAFPSAAPGATVGLGSAALIVACGVGGAWLWWRTKKNNGGLAIRGDRKLVIAETRPLGNRQYLVVADYAGRKFLLGVCPGRIDLLAPLENGAVPPRS